MSAAVRVGGAATAAVVLAVGAVACGGSGSSATSGTRAATAQDAAQVFHAAVTRTAAEKSAQMALTEHVSVAGHSLTISGTGAEDFANHALTLSMSVLGQSLELRQVGDTLYEHLPTGLEQGPFAGKPWIAIDLNTLSTQLTGSSLSQLQQSSQGGDPATMLSYLKSVTDGSITKDGTATIRGVPTTRYNATVDLSKAAAASTAAGRTAVQHLITQLGTSSFPMSVWVDSSGLVHQMTFAFTAHPATSATGGRSVGTVTATCQLQIFNFGTPVTVTAPPASQTTTLTPQMLKLFGGSSGGSSSGTSGSSSGSTSST